MFSLVSLLRHPMTLRGADGADTVIPPSGQVAIVTSTPGALTPIPGIPVPVAQPTTFGDVSGVPDPQPGVLFIVPGIVLSHPSMRGRRDVVAPGTGPADNPVREGGQVVAVTRLVLPPV